MVSTDGFCSQKLTYAGVILAARFLWHRRLSRLNGLALLRLPRLVWATVETYLA